MSFAKDDEAPPLTLAVPPETTNSSEVFQALLRIDDQLHANLLAIEQNAKASQEAALRNSEVLSNGLMAVETAFSTQQKAFSIRTAQQLEIIENSNRTTLISAGGFAAIGALGMLTLAYFQWRMSKAWTGFSTMLASRGLARGPEVQGLAAGHPGQLPPGLVEISNQRLFGVMELLEKRIKELEQGWKPALKAHRTTGSSGDAEELPMTAKGGLSSADPNLSAIHENARIPTLFTQGQLRLKENDLEGAIKVFDELLSLDPNHGEALVKKGAVLERLKRLSEAYECYDRAIAADATLTIAYLHKGGICNRMERFKEALECYEKALLTHDG
jgi:tetratricopeptide (TPR) repeat protein